MKRMAILLAVIIAGSGQVSAADAQVQLERKFVEGTSYKNNVDIQSIQSLKINGMDVETNVTQYMTIVSSIGRRGPDGQIKIDHKMDSLRVQMMIPQLGDIKFDSANPDLEMASLFTPIFKAAAKATWMTTLDKNNLVVAVTGRDEAFNSLDDNLKKFVKGQYEPEYLKDAAQKEAARVPATPIKPNDAWEQSEVMRIDATQILTFRKSYTYHGPEMYNGKMLDRIDVKCLEVKFDVNPNGPIPLTLIKSDLKIGDTSGRLFFDREAGRVVIDEQSHQVKGEFTIKVNDQELPAVLDLRLITNNRE